MDDCITEHTFILGPDDAARLGLAVGAVVACSDPDDGGVYRHVYQGDRRVAGVFEPTDSTPVPKA